MVHPTFRRVKSDTHPGEGNDHSASPPPQSVPPSSYLAPQSSHVAAAQVGYSSVSNPAYIAHKRKRGTSPVLGMILGAVLGCGLLSVVVITAILFAGDVLNREVPVDYESSDVPTIPVVNINGTFTTATIAATVTVERNSNPTATVDATTAVLDATSRAAYETLIPRLNASNDATRTAIAENPPTPLPTRTPAQAAAIGVVTTPSLVPGSPDINGTIVYAVRRDTGDTFTFDIMTLNLATGIETLLTADDSDNTYPVPSPDGRWIAFQSDKDGDSDIYVMNSAGGVPTRLTENDFTDRLPSWSPDGQWIVYSSDVRSDGNYDLYRVRLDGSDNQAVFSNGKRNSHPRYSPDGSKLVFTSGSALDSSTWELVLLDLTTLQQVNLTENDQRDASPVFTPSGNRIMYITTTSNDRAIAIMDADGGNKQVLYDSSGSDWSASYSPDGRYIVFTSSVAGDDNIYLMRATGTNIQLIRAENAVYPSYIN